jgi:hypothetical protein
MNGRCPFQCDLGYQPLHGQCVDNIGWTDMYDANCSLYEESPKWCVNADKYSSANKGSAKDACCVCGGGVRLIDCIPCNNLPDGAVWTTQDGDSSNDNSFPRVWKVRANCDWVCKQVSCSPCVQLYSISCSEQSEKNIHLRATITRYYCTVTLTPCLFLFSMSRFGNTVPCPPPPRLSTNP